MRRGPGRALALYGGALLLAVWTLVPIYWLVNLSLMPPIGVTERQVVVEDPTLENFVRVLGFSYTTAGGEVLPPSGFAPQITAGLVNSLVIASGVLVITLVLVVPASYALGRYDFRGRTGLLGMIVGSRLYPPIAATIPFLALLRATNLQGSRLGLLLAHLTLSVPIAVWMLTGFFRQLPRDIEPAARMDGLTRGQALRKVIVPLSRPALAATAVIVFLLSWNDYTLAVVLNAGFPTQTLPPSLALMFFHVSDPTTMAAGAVLALVPPAILAILFSRRIQTLNLVSV